MKKTIKKKKVFKGRLIDLYLRKERLPNGYIADLEVIEHPGAVLIVPFLARDKVILIRQYRPVIKSYIWELPAGTLSKGEPLLKCAKREMIEEIGYIAGDWKRIGYIYPAPGYATEKIFIFTARRLKKVEAKIQEDEIIKQRVFSKRDIIRLLKSAGFNDAKTISALTLARVF